MNRLAVRMAHGNDNWESILQYKLQVLRQPTSELSGLTACVTPVCRINVRHSLI